MGRSVSRPSGAVAVAYEHLVIFEDDATMQWKCYEEDVVSKARKLAPSFSKCDTWPGREDHAILENSFCYLGLSEYCGLVAIWLLPKEGDDYGDEQAGLRAHWLYRIGPKFHKVFGTLNKEGTMSNGEAVFSRKEAAK